MMLEQWQWKPFEGIEFQQVGFTYPDGRVALSNVSFEARRGEMVALAGPTGAGKTTLAYLVPRYHVASEGQILIDGVTLMILPSIVYAAKLPMSSRRRKRSPFQFLTIYDLVNLKPLRKKSNVSLGLLVSMTSSPIYLKVMKHDLVRSVVNYLSAKNNVFQLLGANS